MNNEVLSYFHLRDLLKYLSDVQRFNQEYQRRPSTAFLSGFLDASSFVHFIQISQERHKECVHKEFKFFMNTSLGLKTISTEVPRPKNETETSDVHNAPGGKTILRGVSRNLEYSHKNYRNIWESLVNFRTLSYFLGMLQNLWELHQRIKIGSVPVEKLKIRQIEENQIKYYVKSY